MIRDLMYIELKTGHHDDGPAWIGYVAASKSGRTIYFNDHAFQRYNGIQGNYIDVETGDEYWLSGVKKRESNRHWAGRGKVMVDRRAVDALLAILGESELPKKRFEVIELADRFPTERVRELLNGKNSGKEQP